PSPQVRVRDRHRVVRRAERHAVRLVRGGDRGALGTAGEVLVEPGGLLGIERAVHPLGSPGAGPLVRRVPVVRAPVGAAEAAHRSAPMDLPLSWWISSAASAARSAARAWRRLSRVRVRSARAATWLTPRAAASS